MSARTLATRVFTSVVIHVSERCALGSGSSLGNVVVRTSNGLVVTPAAMLGIRSVIGSGTSGLMLRTGRGNSTALHFLNSTPGTAIRLCSGTRSSGGGKGCDGPR